MCCVKISTGNGMVDWRLQESGMQAQSFNVKVTIKPHLGLAV